MRKRSFLKFIALFVLTLLAVAGCMSVPQPPPDMNQLIETYEIRLVQQRSIQRTETERGHQPPRDVIAPSSVSSNLFDRHQYVWSDAESITTVGRSIVESSSNDVLDTLADWHRDLKRKLKPTFNVGSKVKISLSPRSLHRLKLDEWKISVERLLENPLQLSVSSDLIELNYSLSW